MVKRRYQRKHAESSDGSDSDDFYEETPISETQPKKYSLRTRRGANLAEDFDYDIVENETNTGTETLLSDDEDYEQEKPIKEMPNSSAERKKLNKEKPVVANCTVRKYKEKEILPELLKSEQSSNKMIDFEDVIRADILVNQSKIDYDNVIEKSEIKLEKQEQSFGSKDNYKKTKNKEPPKKRGRRPKKVLDDYEERLENSYQNNNEDTTGTGLPINTVLGVTESLYELAERYHMQRELMENQVAPSPLATILTENNFPEYAKIAFLESGTTEIQ